MALFRVLIEDFQIVGEEAADVRLPLVLHLLYQLFHHHIELSIIRRQLADILFDSHPEEVVETNLDGVVHAEVEVECRGANHPLDETVDGGDAELGVIVQNVV